MVTQVGLCELSPDRRMVLVESLEFSDGWSLYFWAMWHGER